MPHRLYVDGDRLVVELSGLEVVEALRRRIEVPLSQVESVEAPRPTWGSLRSEVALRLAGTSIPGRVMEGLFAVRGGGLGFYAVRDPSRVVVVRLRGGRLSRLVVDVEDPDAVVAEVSAAVGARG